MDIETLRNYCLSKPGAEEYTPFGDDNLVYKVFKMFALISITPPFAINLKCDPEKAIELRDQYPEAILPGYHMNKKHWNTVMLEEGLPDSFIKGLVDHSYNLVVKGLKKSEKEDLAAI
jgi:predicted DNA-binding protein (MmcQ/YjbR family)